MTPIGLPRKPPFPILLAVWLLLAAPVIYNCVDSVQSLLNTLASRHWPYVSGVVDKSDVRGRNLCSAPRIKYMYIVHGITFQSSSRVAGIEECFLADVANSLAANHTPGDSLRVYYDPMNPSNATLLPGRITRNAWLGIFFLPIFLFSWLLIGWRMLKSGCSRSSSVIYFK